MKNELLSDCPVETALNVLGNKWVVLIIRELLLGPKRHSELQKNITGISQKVLTANLKKLEKNEVINRSVFSTNPPHVEYSLTQFGQTLKPVLVALATWGLKFQNLSLFKSVVKLTKT